MVMAGLLATLLVRRDCSDPPTALTKSGLAMSATAKPRWRTTVLVSMVLLAVIAVMAVAGGVIVAVLIVESGRLGD